MSDPILSIEEIRRRAAQAVDKGLPMRVCPYPKDSEAAKHWIVGYWMREAELMKRETAAA